MTDEKWAEIVKRGKVTWGVDLASGPDYTVYHHRIECNASARTPIGEGICICLKELKRAGLQEGA